MKRVVASATFLILLITLAGCQGNQTRIGEGALIGGLLGATAGGIVGHQGGHGGQGAGIGAAAGALTGALVGAQIEKQPGQTAQGASAANANQMTMQQIVDLSKQGINEAVIIDRIRITNSKFSLVQSDVDYLKQQGVSDAIIAVMQGK